MEIENKNRTDLTAEEQAAYAGAEEEEQRRKRRRERIEQMKREKERRLRLQRIITAAAPAAGLALLVCAAAAVIHGTRSADGKDAAQDSHAQSQTADRTEQEEEEILEEGSLFPPPEPSVLPPAENAGSGSVQPASAPVRYSAQMTPDTALPPDEVDSEKAVFIDLETGNILAERDCREAANPASMTKVLTVLVAAEHAEDLEDTFTMTVDITDYSYSNDCSSVGFDIGETVTVRDLFYGTILPSGGDAALALAVYTAGSHEAFVEMMNRKAEELGLSETAHFTNCIGLYDAEHHCSVYDIAMIMEAAVNNDLCREVLAAHTYTTSATEQHPEGITISNWFLRRIEDKETGGEVVCAKTGFVAQSGNCAVSYGTDRAGKEYICATIGARSAWRCIYDHAALYRAYADTQTAETVPPDLFRE